MCYYHDSCRASEPRFILNEAKVHLFTSFLRKKRKKQACLHVSCQNKMPSTLLLSVPFVWEKKEAICLSQWWTCSCELWNCLSKWHIHLRWIQIRPRKKVKCALTCSAKFAQCYSVEGKAAGQGSKNNVEQQQPCASARDCTAMFGSYLQANRFLTF